MNQPAWLRIGLLGLALNFALCCLAFTPSLFAQADGDVVLLNRDIGSRLVGVGIANSEAIAVDLASPGIYVAGWRDGNSEVIGLFSIDGSFQRILFESDEGIIRGLAVDPGTGELYSLRTDPAMNKGRIRVIEPASGSILREFLFEPGFGPLADFASMDLAFDSRRNRLLVYFDDGFGGAIYRISRVGVPMGGPVLLSAPGIAFFSGLTYDEDRDRLLLSADGRVVAFDQQGNQVSHPFSDDSGILSDVGSIWSLSSDPGANYLLAASRDNNRVHVFANPATIGASELLFSTSGAFKVGDLAINDQNGDFLFADTGGGMTVVTRDFVLVRRAQVESRQLSGLVYNPVNGLVYGISSRSLVAASDGQFQSNLLNQGVLTSFTLDGSPRWQRQRAAFAGASGLAVDRDNGELWVSRQWADGNDRWVYQILRLAGDGKILETIDLVDLGLPATVAEERSYLLEDIAYSPDDASLFLLINFPPGGRAPSGPYLYKLDKKGKKKKTMPIPRRSAANPQNALAWHPHTGEILIAGGTESIQVSNLIGFGQREATHGEDITHLDVEGGVARRRAIRLQERARRALLQSREDLAPPENFQADASSEDIVLTWDIPESTSPSVVLLYAGSASGQYELGSVATLPAAAERANLPHSLPGAGPFFLALAAQGAAGESTFSNEVVVQLPSLTSQASGIYFRADRERIGPGESVRLSWKFRGVSSVFLANQMGSPLPAQGTLMVAPRQTTRYILQAQGSDGTGTVVLDATVTVSPTAARIKRFEVDAVHLDQPGNVEFRWRSRNAAEVRLLPNDLLLTASGTMSLFVQQSTTFRLIAADGNGQSVAKTRRIKVGGNPATPEIYRFEAFPAVLAFDASGLGALHSTLDWQVEGADLVTIVEETTGNLLLATAEASGRLKVFPSATTTYVIRAMQGNQSTEERVRVVVQ